jgi:hypothetical protein
MNANFSGPPLAYLIIALVVLGLAFAGIVWVGRMIRGELGSGAARGGDPAGLAMLEQVPPAMMKEAIARGLVVPSQLAGMTAIERTFLFASLKQRLASTEPTAPVAAPTAVHVASPTSAPAPMPPAPALPAGVPPAMLAILNAEKLRVWCPMCGTELQLPTFPPLLARCTNCGMKSAVRSEEGGRYVVLVSPPPKL